MYLLGIPEPCCNEHAAVRQPIEEDGAARVEIPLEPLREHCIARRYAFEDQVAALLANRSLGVSEGGEEDCGE